MIKSKMKQIIKVFIITVILLTILGCKKQDEKIINEFVVLFSFGNVKSGDTELKAGNIFKSDKPLKVGKKSICDIQLINSDSTIAMRIGPNSEIEWRSKNVNGKSYIIPKIKKGKVLFYIQKLSANDRFNVISPALKTTVTGTKFYLDIAETGKSTLMVIEGKVKVKPGYKELEGLPVDKIKEIERLVSYFSQSEYDNWQEIPEEKVESLESIEFWKQISEVQFIELKPEFITKVEKLFGEILSGQEVSKEDLKLLKNGDYLHAGSIQGPPFLELFESLKLDILELDNLPIFQKNNPEKVREAVLMRLDTMEKIYKNRISKIIIENKEFILTKSGKKIECVMTYFPLREEYFYFYTEKGKEEILVGDIKEIIFRD
ncbi:MAG: FecR domain-containing protein [Leptospiraceae bacterium]|nr:FecR domain-containing protein [Leptospiraceae bacterium]